MSRFLDIFRRILLQNFMIPAACTICGCSFAGDPPQKGLYFIKNSADFGIVKVTDTAYDGGGLVNNTDSSFTIRRPKLAHGIYFWIADNLPGSVETLSPGNYGEFPSFGFSTSASGTYRDTLLIFESPDSTHILLSEPIVATCR